MTWVNPVMFWVLRIKCKSGDDETCVLSALLFPSPWQARTKHIRGTRQSGPAGQRYKPACLSRARRGTGLLRCAIRAGGCGVATHLGNPHQAYGDPILPEQRDPQGT